MKSRFTKRNILKLILATIAFYALLAMNVFHVGEKIVPMQKDYLWLEIPEASGAKTTGQKYINQAVQEFQQEKETHQAAADNTGNTGDIKDQIGFQAICTSDQKMCSKVDFIGNYTDRDKYLYLGGIFKVADFIDNTLITKQKAENALNAIILNKNIGDRRGYSTHDTVNLYLGAVTSKQEFLELVSHEMGHILDLGILQGTSKIKNGDFTEFGNAVFGNDDISLIYYAISRQSETIRKAVSSKKDFCSGYGMSDPFEDFAECFNLYLNHNSFFKQIAKADKAMKQKYNYIAGLFAGNYINANKGDLSLIKTDLIRRPRDSTKMD